LIEFADTAADAIQDAYNESKMIEAVRFCWQTGKKKSMEPFLRTAVDFSPCPQHAPSQ